VAGWSPGRPSRPRSCARSSRRLGHRRSLARQAMRAAPGGRASAGLAGGAPAGSMQVTGGVEAADGPRPPWSTGVDHQSGRCDPAWYVQERRSRRPYVMTPAPPQCAPLSMPSATDRWPGATSTPNRDEDPNQVPVPIHSALPGAGSACSRPLPAEEGTYRGEAATRPLDDGTPPRRQPRRRHRDPS
jgi:hypothetical protein